MWCNKPQSAPRHGWWFDSHRLASVTYHFCFLGLCSVLRARECFGALHCYGGLLTEDRDTGRADVLSLPALGAGAGKKNVCTECWGFQPLAHQVQGQLVGFCNKLFLFLPSRLSQDPSSCPLNSMWSKFWGPDPGGSPSAPIPSLQRGCCSATHSPRLSHGGPRLAPAPPLLPAE